MQEKSFGLLKVLGWMPPDGSDEDRTLRHYQQYPDLELAMCLQRERAKHFALLQEYPDLKDPVARISHPRLPRLKNITRRIELLERIQSQRAHPASNPQPSDPVSSAAERQADRAASEKIFEPSPLGADREAESVPSASSSDLTNTLKAKRRTLRDRHKAAWKIAGVRVTDEMIAKAANPPDGKNRGWTNRTHVQKWLTCHPKYGGRNDKLMRDVLLKGPNSKPAPVGYPIPPKSA